MAGHYWYCEHCGTDVLGGNTHPPVGGCSKAQMHKWYDLGKKGTDYLWECKHCDTQVIMDSKPNAQGCSVDTLRAWAEKLADKQGNSYARSGHSERVGKKSFWSPVWAIPFKLIWSMFKGIWWVLKKVAGR